MIRTTTVLDPGSLAFGDNVTDTSFGQVTLTRRHMVHIDATPEELAAWAHRDGARWPNSALADCTGNVSATFGPDGALLDAEHPGVDDIPNPEFTAWASDCLASANLTHHPAYRS